MQEPQEPLRTEATADAPASADRTWERRTLEALAFATLHEQKMARRWKVGFRLAWLLLISAVFWQAFSYNSPAISPSMPHTAMVSIKGEIASEGDGSAENIMAAMRSAGRFDTYIKWGLKSDLDRDATGFGSKEADDIDARFIHGTPEQCAEALAGLRDKLGMTHFMYKPQWPGLPHAGTTRRTRSTWPQVQDSGRCASGRDRFPPKDRRGNGVRGARFRDVANRRAVTAGARRRRR